MRITVRTYRPTVSAAPAAATYSLYPVTYSLNYAFSAKERDVETGLSYFGARYYSSDLSIWLSVDPMSDKYPSMSPYVYCADNPVRCVDPNGEEVVIEGSYDDKLAAFNSLQSGTNLQLEFNKESGKVTAMGDPRNDNDKLLLEAINSSDVKCIIQTDCIKAGEFHGTEYSESNNTAISTNSINLSELSKYERKGASGSGIIHEITEGYSIGRFVVDVRKADVPKYAAEGHMEFISLGLGEHTKIVQQFVPHHPEFYEIYDMGHRSATKAPNEMSRKEALSYKLVTYTNCYIFPPVYGLYFK